MRNTTRRVRTAKHTHSNVRRLAITMPTDPSQPPPHIGKGVLQDEYVHWSECDCHQAMLRTSEIDVYFGHLSANAATKMHSHTQDSFAVATKSMPYLLERRMPRPYTDPHHLVDNHLALRLGACMFNIPPDAATPYVHCVQSGECGAAFIAIESPFASPPASFRAPPICASGDVDVVSIPAISHFSSALPVRIPPQGVARFSSPRTVHAHVARMIVALQTDFTHVGVTNLLDDVSTSLLQKKLPGVDMAALVIHNLNDIGAGDRLETWVRNNGKQEWSAVIGDIYIAKPIC